METEFSSMENLLYEIENIAADGEEDEKSKTIFEAFCTNLSDSQRQQLQYEIRHPRERGPLFFLLSEYHLLYYYSDQDPPPPAAENFELLTANIDRIVSPYWNTCPRCDSPIIILESLVVPKALEENQSYSDRVKSLDHCSACGGSNA